MQRSHLFIHHPDEFVQNYMQPIDKIILTRQDKNTLKGARRKARGTGRGVQENDKFTGFPVRKTLGNEYSQ
jgi:hypothetical protein